MFQDGQLFEHLDVAGNVGYPLRLRHRGAPGATATGWPSCSTSSAWPGTTHARPPPCSGGERQRVALARALAVEPRLLLLDEPLSALDRGLRERLAGDLHDILRAAGVTAVLVTHDQEEAFAVADTDGGDAGGPAGPAGQPRRRLGAPGRRLDRPLPGVRRGAGGRPGRPLPAGWSPPRRPGRRSRCAAPRCGSTRPGSLEATVEEARLDPRAGAAASRRRRAGGRCPASQRPRPSYAWGSGCASASTRPGPPRCPVAPRLRLVRRAYTTMVTIAVVMGLLAYFTGQALGLPMRDPDGFLGPAWVRAPMLVLGAFVADIVPRTLWRLAVPAPGVPPRGAPADPRALDPGADPGGRARGDLLLRHLRQLPQPEELPAVRARRRRPAGRLRAAQVRPVAVPRQRPRRRAARRARHHASPRRCCRGST